MIKKKRSVSCLLNVLLSILFIVGCAKKSIGQYSYKTENVQHWDSLYITQTTYYDDRVEIELDGKFSKNDLKFNSPDESDAVTDKQNDTITIYSYDPTDITSLNIKGSWYELEFRYLNTDEYACIWRTWADDLGWEEYSGDTDKFYTEEEKKQQRESEENAKMLKEKAQKEDAELFEIFQGKWLSDDGDYFDIYDTASAHGVKYYQSDIQKTEEYQGFVFSKYEDDLYRMTYMENGWGVCVKYDIEYSGEDSFLYNGKAFARLTDK